MSAFVRSRKGDKLWGNVPGADRREIRGVRLGEERPGVTRPGVVRAGSSRAPVHPLGAELAHFRAKSRGAGARKHRGVHKLGIRLRSNSPNQDSTFSPIASAGLPPANSPQTSLEPRDVRRSFLWVPQALPAKQLCIRDAIALLTLWNRHEV